MRVVILSCMVSPGRLSALVSLPHRCVAMLAGGQGGQGAQKEKGVEEQRRDGRSLASLWTPCGCARHHDLRS